MATKQEKLQRTYAPPGEGELVTFGLEGRVEASETNFRRMHQIAVEIGRMTGHEVGIDISDFERTPSVLVELVSTTPEGTLLAYAVTDGAMGRYVAAEFGVSESAGRGLYWDVKEHYMSHHDWDIFVFRTRNAVRQNMPLPEPPRCGCPLGVVRGSIIWSGEGAKRRWDFGIVPESLVTMVEEKIPISNVGKLRRKYLESIADRLARDAK